MSRQQHLVSVTWLARALAEPHRPHELVVVDCRCYLDGRDARAVHAEGHIPGARWVDVDRELAGPVAADGAGGRHPLPSLEAFAATLARLVFIATASSSPTTTARGGIAARLWWMLRYVGLAGGRVLDGGIDGWVAAGHELEQGEVTATPSEPMALQADPRMVVDAAVVAARPDGEVLLDARTADRFRGEVEPIDPVAGHIPGATNVPWPDNLSDGVLADDEVLRARYQTAMQADGVTVYCGSGVTACHDLLALSVLGRHDAKLYVGSWSDWSSDRDRPVATGDD